MREKIKESVEKIISEFRSCNLFSEEELEKLKNSLENQITEQVKQFVKENILEHGVRVQEEAWEIANQL